MHIKYKNSEINFFLKESNVTDGLSNNDCWLYVDMHVLNDEFKYDVERYSLTKNEVLKGIEYLKEYYYNEKRITSELKFIKNYFIIKLKKIDEKKVMEFKLIKIADKKNKNYSLFFEDEEIENFINLSINNRNF